MRNSKTSSKRRWMGGWVKKLDITYGPEGIELCVRHICSLYVDVDKICIEKPQARDLTFR